MIEKILLSKLQLSPNSIVDVCVTSRLQLNDQYASRAMQALAARAMEILRTIIAVTLIRR